MGSCKPNTIEIDGMKYTPAKKEVSGDRVVAVLDRGWIFVGSLTSLADGEFVLSNAANVRCWKSGGFGALSLGAKKAGATLDDCADVRFRRDACVFMVPIPGDWEKS